MEKTPATTQNDTSQNPEAIAESLASSICAEIESAPLDVQSHQRALQDLKLAVVNAAAGLEEDGKLGKVTTGSEFIWSLARVLPDFDMSGLYEKRSTLASIAGAVLIGWFLGGIFAAVLDIIGLGGDIIRAAAIFAAIWFNEYIGANPRARKIMLACLGLGALGRFAGMLASGLVRFSGLASFRQLVFGAARPNIFKSVWLLAGAFFLYIFFSKKVTGLDLGGFTQNLRNQIEQRLTLAIFVLHETGTRDALLRKFENSAQQGATQDLCPKKNCQLANGVLAILDSLDPDKRTYLAEKLDRAGFAPKAPVAGASTFIWDSARDTELYTPVGLIADGDLCRILRAPHKAGDVLVKGNAQRIISQQAGHSARQS